MVEHAGRALIVQAGTATSTRLRNNEPQSFNWLSMDQRETIDLQVIAWDGTGFQGASHVRFAFEGDSWSPCELEDSRPWKPRAAEAVR